MKFLRPFVALLMIFICIFYSGSIYFLYNSRALTIREEHTAEKLEQDHAEELQKLVIPIKDVRWIDEQEFIYDEKFYDIASSSVTNDTLYCLAYCDNEEKELQKHLLDFTGEQEEESEDANKTAEAYPYCIVSRHIIFSSDYRDCSFPENTYNKLYTGFMAVLLPPPKA